MKTTLARDSSKRSKVEATATALGSREEGTWQRIQFYLHEANEKLIGN
jgi:hypothetical protein